MADNTNKRKHETLSLVKKFEILQKLDSGQKSLKLAREYNVGRATIYDIKKNRKKIEHYINNSGPEASSRLTLKNCEYLLMEDVLFSWFLDERQQNKALTEKNIQKKSLHFYKEIYKNDNFKASDGWFRNFKARYGIRGLYEPVTKRNVTNSNDALCDSIQNDEVKEIGVVTMDNVNMLASTSESEHFERLEIVVPKIEPEDETTDAKQQSEDLSWPDSQTDDDSIENDTSVSLDKKDANIDYNDLTIAEENCMFMSHVKTRMDKLNYEQRFIAQKLISDVMMLAETDQLQLTSAVVNRPLKQEQAKTKNAGKRSDPLNI